MPIELHEAGIQGLTYQKFDSTICSYCSVINGAIQAGLLFAWQGNAWDGVEVLTGKIMKPTANNKKTILVGQCMCNLHRNNVNLANPIFIEGCPPEGADIIKAFKKAGIMIDQTLFDNLEYGPAFFMEKYVDKPEFEESFYTIQ